MPRLPLPVFNTNHKKRHCYHNSGAVHSSSVSHATIYILQMMSMQPTDGASHAPSAVLLMKAV